MQTEALVIGGNGLIGRTLLSNLKSNGTSAIGTYYKREEPELVPLNITSKEDLEKLFETYQPKHVYHCANLAGGVNFCEANPEMAEKFHYAATVDIGNLCKQHDAKLLFISSDYVFSDHDGGAVEESHPKNPLNLYGKLKLKSEKWIEKELSDYVIIRTTNVYGWDPLTVTPNVLMGLYRTLIDNKEAQAPSFLLGNPTYAPDICEVLLELAEKDKKGIYHVVGPQYIDRYKWSLEAAKLLELSVGNVKEKSVAPENMIPRPMKLSLSTKKLSSEISTKLKDVNQGLLAMRKEMVNNKL